MFLILVPCILISTASVFAVLKSIPMVSSMFIAAGLFGKDLCKRNQSIKIPEAQGIVSGTIFLLSMFAFLGVRFGQHFLGRNLPFPHDQFSEFLTALLCICCMLLLGFSDDVLNLKWRFKLVLPTIASVPLLMVYYINGGSTTIIIPKPFRDILGLSINIGPLYYIYMSLLAVFCTNAINIYAGINGLESGQALVMALSVVAFNVVEFGGFQREAHIFSFSVMVPFAATTLALFYYNKYPARAFVGDTFTYFAGMTFAVVGIIGRFSKSLLLFFIPQVLNFLYSTPQLFRIVPCPRHRIPRYNKATDCLEPSEVKFKSSDVRKPFLLILRILSFLKVVQLSETAEKKGVTTCHLNNLTLINLLLVWFGPMRERSLTNALLAVQVAASFVAFFIRYPLAEFFYD